MVVVCPRPVALSGAACDAVVQRFDRYLALNLCLSAASNAGKTSVQAAAASKLPFGAILVTTTRAVLQAPDPATVQTLSAGCC